MRRIVRVPHLDGTGSIDHKRLSKQQVTLLEKASEGQIVSTRTTAGQASVRHGLLTESGSITEKGKQALRDGYFILADDHEDRQFAQAVRVLMQRWGIPRTAAIRRAVLEAADEH